MSFNPIARLSYMMASEPKLGSLIYKQLDNTKYFSMPYFARMLINFKFGKTFSLERISGEFLSKAHLNAVVNRVRLSHDEKELIKRRIYEKFELVEFKGIVICWVLADIIKNYERPFALMPLILNYGKDKFLSHQAAFIYDRRSRKLVFYEPYGTYEKYGINYENKFDPLHYILFGSEGTVPTFHKFYKLGLGTQMMIINSNNTHAKEFKSELADIKKRYDTYDNTGWTQPKLENKKFDVSIESMRILDDVEDVALSNKDYQLIEDSYRLFHKWSAKTCVTLTFIDMFFLSRYGVNNLKMFYKNVERHKYPSEFLINTFGNILFEVYGKKLSPVVKMLADVRNSNEVVVQYLT